MHRICALGRVSSEVRRRHPIVILLRSHDDEGARIAAAVAVAAGAEGLAAVGPLDDGAAGAGPAQGYPLVEQDEFSFGDSKRARRKRNDLTSRTGIDGVLDVCRVVQSGSPRV